jgi:hypothetical protein
MCNHQQVALRTEAETRITRETLARAEALLEHFDSHLYPLCQMPEAIVRPLHKKLGAFVEHLDDLLCVYRRR